MAVKELYLDIKTEHIKILNGFLGMTYEEMASNLGVSRTTLFLYEKQELSMSDEFKLKIYNLLLKKIKENISKPDNVYTVILYALLESLEGKDIVSAPFFTRIFKNMSLEEMSKLGTKMHQYKYRQKQKEMKK